MSFRLKLFVWIGIMAAFLGATGDILLLYNPIGGYETGDYLFYQAIEPARMLWGHYLGIFFIPLELLGFLLVYEGMKPAGEKWAKLVYGLAIYSVFPGVAYHATCAFAGNLMHKGADPELLQSFQQLSEPLAAAFILGFLVLSVIYAVFVLKGKSHFPKWLAFANPVSFYLLFLFCYFLIPPVGNFLMPAGFNLAMGIFLILSFLTFQKKQA